MIRKIKPHFAMAVICSNCIDDHGSVERRDSFSCEHTVPCGPSRTILPVATTAARHRVVEINNKSFPVRAHMHTGSSDTSGSFHAATVPVVVAPQLQSLKLTDLASPDFADQKQNSRKTSRGVSIKAGNLALPDRQILMLRKALPPHLFPLSLTPLDQYFCSDDSVNFPMTSIIHMDFSGEVDGSAFSEALDDALVRHPLLGAYVRIAKRGLPCWIPADDEEPFIDVGPLEQPLQLPGREGFDLARELGFRFWIRSSPAKSRVTLQVHHACTDGTGVYRFLGDLWALYGMRTATGDDVPVLGDIDWRLLRSRRRRITDLANRTEPGAAFVCQGLREGLRIFGSCVQPLANPRPGQGTADHPLCEFPGIATVTLDKEHHEQLRTFAARHGAMLNDLLMAEMFRTIVRWNEKFGQLRKHRKIRLLMPSDLRSTDDYAMPATNMTAYTFLSQKPRDCCDIARLLQSIREQTGRIKHERLGTRFVDALTLAEYAPWVLQSLLSRNSCMATAVLSNIGDPSRRFTSRFPRNKGRVVCGNVTLEGVCGVPPLRRHSHATVSIFTYLRKLTISVRCNPYLFDESQTRAFLAMYEEGLLRYIT